MTQDAQPAGGTPGQGQQQGAGQAAAGDERPLSEQLRDKVREANEQSEHRWGRER